VVIPVLGLVLRNEENSIDQVLYSYICVISERTYLFAKSIVCCIDSANWAASLATPRGCSLVSLTEKSVLVMPAQHLSLFVV
jgi:hypothetical protein